MEAVYLVCYDIADPKRLRKVHKATEDHGPRLQLSVYQCELTELQVAAFRADLAEIINSNEDQVNLEHVLPNRASDKDWGKNFTVEERKDYLHRIGNLALLQKGPNGRLGNKPFKDKKPILTQSAFTLTAEIGKESDWTKDSIKARQSRMAKLVTKVWPRS